MPIVDDYIAATLMRDPGILVDLHRPTDIETQRGKRCLSPNGERMFMDAVRYYVAGCREWGDELVAKSRAFLELAQTTGEQQQYNYTVHFSESRRSSALSFVHWLSTGEVDQATLTDARTNIDAYYSHSRTLDRGSARLGVPVLLYTEAYSVIRKIAEQLSVGIDGSSLRNATGLFGHALRIASAVHDGERRAEAENLRKQMGKQLFSWIDRGHYDDVAYMLYALFPRPDGLPSRLIQDCWQYIPENLISKRLAEMRSLGLIADQ